MPGLSKEERHQFDQNGFVILKNFFDQELVTELRNACHLLVTEHIRKLMQDSSQNGGRETLELAKEPMETRLIKLKDLNPDYVPLLFRAELHHPAFFALFGNRKLLELVSGMLPGATDIRVFPNYSCRPKLPNFEPHSVVWHQDAGLAADGRPSVAPVADRLEAFGPGRVVNVWTPLVEATPTTGCMKAIPGSHHLGIQQHVVAHRYRSQKEAHTYGTYAAEIDPEVMAQHEACAVQLSCSPGDVILFSNLLIHRGGQNTSDIVRWSFDWRYQDAAYPTHRDETGHVMWSRANQDPVIKTANEWARLSLT